MTYKILILAIDALTLLAYQKKSNTTSFNNALDDAIIALENVKKYFEDDGIVHY